MLLTLQKMVRDSLPWRKEAIKGAVVPIQVLRFADANYGIVCRYALVHKNATAHEEA